MTTTERKLLWPDLLNTRELGGYETTEGRTVGWQRLVRSSDLDRLTPAGQAALIDYGVRTIIDLRTPWEAANFPCPFVQQEASDGLPRYQNIPLIGDDNAAYESAAAGVWLPSVTYRLILHHFPGQVAEIFRTLAHAQAGTILFYCHAGKDRTGVVAALLLALLRVSPEQIAANYAESERNVQPLLDEWLARVGDDLEQQERQKAIWSAQPATLLELLAFLAADYGGVESYLLRAGVTPDEIDTIRARFLV